MATILISQADFVRLC